MAVSSAGPLYEKKVSDAIKAAAKRNKNIVLMPGGTAAFNRFDVDLKIKVKNQLLNIEVKSSADDQMGGTSVKYTAYPTIDIAPVLQNGQPSVDNDAFSIIVDALKGTEKGLKDFVDFYKTQPPIALHDKVMGFPMSVSADAWTLAKEKGLLKPLNRKVKLDTSFITKHYKKKNVFYIQIGGAGFFYLDSNPLRLPIPKLSGEIDVEIRAARSGSKQNMTYKTETVGGGIRAQARLKTKNTSPYSIDDPDHVLALFGK